MISIVVPCYNEAEVLLHTHERLSAAADKLDAGHTEIVYVDDGSADDTWKILLSLAQQDDRVRAIRLSRNFGHQAACLAGLRSAGGDAVVVIDADLQDPPELIPEMVGLWRDGWAVVSAKRRRRAGETAFKKASAYVFYRLLNALSDHPLALDTGDFRLLDRAVVRGLADLDDRNLFLRGAISWFGHPETSIEYDRDPRFAGESKYTLRKMLALSRRGMLAGSVAPLRVTSYAGVSALVGGLALSSVRRTPGPLTRSCGFAIQALALGVLGEYLHAVLRQVQNRPDYIIEEQFTRASCPVPVVEGCAP
ncbi:glycosyltransferase family 2 protein [Streptomyces sp. NPDC093510]|uniref:glycosyltransferase family 2 protein n=1 Tax=Streptomyces sp. NPDC093510 TaxID=3155199 RepID=UPI00342E67BF